MNFRKKPVVIEAIQWDGTHKSAGDIFKAFPELQTNCFTYTLNLEDANPISWTIYTLEGFTTATPNDWIIKGVKGEFYPCKPDIFEMTYEAVDGNS